MGATDTLPALVPAWWTVKAAVRAFVYDMAVMQARLAGGDSDPDILEAIRAGSAALDDLQAFVQNRMDQMADHTEMLAAMASLHEWALEHEEEAG